MLPFYLLSSFYKYPLSMAQYKNNRNNGEIVTRAPSVVINVGDFIVPTGIAGGYIPYSASETLTMTVTGTFVVGETVSQATSSATGVVVAQSASGITVKSVTGTFDTSHLVTGGTSAATGTPSLITANSKIFGVSNGAYATTDSTFASSGTKINVSTPVKIMDYLYIPVSAGTATSALEGTYVNVDPAHPGSVDVTAVGTQIYVFQVVDSANIIGVVSLTV